MARGIAVDGLSGDMLTLSFSAAADLDDALHALRELLKEGGN